MWIWERLEWPDFTYDIKAVMPQLLKAHGAEKRLLGVMEGLGFDLQSHAYLQTLIQDVVQSSAIEGERLAPEDVRSSIARRLGMDVGGLRPVNRSVEGVVEMMVDATRNYSEKLTAERIYAWHAALFPTGRSGMQEIIVGAYRDDAKGPMQVLSGPMGRETVHYEAPPANRLETEMSAFFHWFETSPITDLAQVAIAHLYFVTLHPFADGNGRMARAIADMALSRFDGSSQRFYSMSAQIHAEKNDYYNMLESTQRCKTSVTDWVLWFLGCFERAVHNSEAALETTMNRHRFWQAWAAIDLNERQSKVLNRMLGDKGPWEGKLTTKKYASLVKKSADTAQRDIKDLVNKGVLVKDDSAGGRSTSYLLVPV